MASSSPCAACKFLRRKCLPECFFAPYFPPDQLEKFVNVQKVFGASNVAKLLKKVQPHQREDAVNSLVYEANMRLLNPVYGCVGIISLLQDQIRQLQMDLIAAHQGINILGDGVSARDHDHFHHQHFPVSQQHIIGAFDGGSGFDASSLLAMNMAGSDVVDDI